MTSRPRPWTGKRRPSRTPCSTRSAKGSSCSRPWPATSAPATTPRTPANGGTAKASSRPRGCTPISRDGDPQLHVHLAVLNAVQRADGADDTWRAADGQHFYQLRHLYGVTVDRAFEQRLLDMGYAMTERADGNGAEIGGVSQQVMDRFSSRARAIGGKLRTWVDQYTATHGKPPSRRTIYLMGQEIAKDTRRPKAEAKRMAGGQVTGHEVTDEERLKAWEDQTTSDELQVLSAVHAEAKAYAARSTLAAVT